MFADVVADQIEILFGKLVGAFFAISSSDDGDHAFRILIYV